MDFIEFGQEEADKIILHASCLCFGIFSDLNIVRNSSYECLF